MVPHYWQQAIADLSLKDPKIKKIIELNSKLELTSRGDAYQTLARAVVGQQISVKAADSIWKKLTNYVSKTTPEKIVKYSVEELKKTGLSLQKATYLQNIAFYFKENKINSENYWKNKNYEEISKELIQIKGVGNWTIEMFGIFFLLEPDIFPSKDLGLINAINLLYGGKEKLKIEKILKLSEIWKPWRTVATCFLWRSIDSSIVSY